MSDDTQPRRFSTSQRAVLFVAAAGRCQSCGCELGAGWHADHKRPYSHGGATDVTNGAALCPACNLRKGSRMIALREWQTAALERYQRLDQRDFLAVACPGSGKTLWALTVARSLLKDGLIERVIVVTPSDELRNQWSDNSAAGVNLRPFSVREPRVDKRGFDGIVTTYQALSTGVSAGVIQQSVNERTLVILDEIHHAADNSTFGVNLRATFANAGRRLLLTGTPWRTDARERMPFVTFDQFTREVNVDYTYSYGRAVRDAVCRPIEFPLVNGRGDFRRDGELRRVDMRVDADIDESDESAAMLALLSADGEWLADVIKQAHADLNSIRSEIPDAAGLIVAKDKEHAQRIKQLLYRAAGVAAPVIVSGDDDGDSAAAKDAIDRFRRSRDPWVIAVKMIAEGVDVPRLMVGVYATTITTAMFFNQVVGRFVRVRSGERVTAKLYVPPRQSIWQHVVQIENQLLQVKKDAEKLAREAGGSGGAAQSELVVVGSVSEGLDRVHTFGGDLAGGDIIQMQRVFADAGIPTHYASNAVGVGLAPTAPTASSVMTAPAPVAEPRHRVEKRLRADIKGLVGRVAHHCYLDHQAGQEVNADLWRLYGKSRSVMTVEELNTVKDVLERCLETGERV